MFTISSWVCGRGFGRSASLQILAIAKLLLLFAPRNPSPTASPTPSFEIMNTFLVGGRSAATLAVGLEEFGAGRIDDQNIALIGKTGFISL